jgi:transcriptional regulator with XRE-family HTH domain
MMEVLQLTGVDQTTLSHAERGLCLLDEYRARRIAKALDADMHTLFATVDDVHFWRLIDPPDSAAMLMKYQATAALRELRKSKNLTLHDLQRRSGVDTTALSYIERGEDSTHERNAKRIAAALDVDIETIFFRYTKAPVVSAGHACKNPGGCHGHSDSEAGKETGS